ncbi:RNA polymerase sigma factor [Erwinia sp. JUb26]|uniref:RNA polymerase sigma factor n=1 Tax=Erwinia sp. JUb26 TaxID=2485126 RepID=UPI000F4A21F8|nr:sigma-70 family RNA polymerase sigma factor [Erwinia sp. JUb26]ROR05138.1 RNA polymerase sigma-70 factor (ECF subfamily) [Erwinia sp. JUb26]
MAEESIDSQVLLIRAVAAGDKRAFEALYRSYSPYLFAIALRLLHRRGWAEEVLHDSFLTLWQRADTFDPTLSAPKTWLTNIVRHRAIDYLRLQDNRVLELDDENDTVAGENEHDHPPTTTESRRLLTCMDALPAEQRQSVVLAYHHGLSHSEIALHLQQPAGTVKSWIRRALMHLKGCVGI